MTVTSCCVCDRDRLAIQLPDRILIYETGQSDEFDMHYKLREKISQSLPCNLLVVVSRNVILCQERKLQLYSLGGKKLHEWLLDSVIRYIKVVGGPLGREGLLVGLKDGDVYKIFVNNKFPIHILKHTAGIRCLDMNASRKKLAVVDENSAVVIYDVLSKAVLFEGVNARRVRERKHRLDPRACVCVSRITPTAWRGTRTWTTCSATRVISSSVSRRRTSRCTNSACRDSWSASRAPRCSACSSSQ